MTKLRVQHLGTKEPGVVWEGHHIMLPSSFLVPSKNLVSGVGQCRHCLARFYAVREGDQVVVWPLNGSVKTCQ